MEEDRYIRITLRIPRDTHARLETEAAKNSHSMNAEIVARLESTFKPEQQSLDLGLAPLRDEIQGLRQQMQGHQEWIEHLVKSGADVRLNDQGQLEGFTMEIPAANVKAALKRSQETFVPLESVDKPIDASQLLGTSGADEEEIQSVPEFVKKLGSVVYPTRAKGTVKKPAK